MSKSQRIITWVCLIILLTAVWLPAIDECWVVEIERYSIGMEITHTEQSTYHIRHIGTETTRTFYLRGDDKAIAVNVDEQTYAQFAQGDWVEVEFQVIECSLSHCIEERATIIGAMVNEENSQ